MEEEDDSIEISELREKWDAIYKISSNLKTQIRKNTIDIDESIDKSEHIACAIDDLICVVEGSSLGSLFSEYERFFKRNYEYKKCYRNSLLFRGEEFNLIDPDGREDRFKRYFNYLVRYLIMINHFIMSLEFQKMRKELMIPDNMKE